MITIGVVCVVSVCACMCVVCVVSVCACMCVVCARFT